nr:MAG TPA: helix-turn-helix domain protein [Caudoviricetes sp.]
MKLRQLRHMLGLSQLQFAEDLGVAQNTLSNYESDEIKTITPHVRA